LHAVVELYVVDPAVKDHSWGGSSGRLDDSVAVGEDLAQGDLYDHRQLYTHGVPDGSGYDPGQHHLTPCGISATYVQIAAGDFEPAG
jgi:hypothetical protein